MCLLNNNLVDFHVYFHKYFKYLFLLLKKSTTHLEYQIQLTMFGYVKHFRLSPYPIRSSFSLIQWEMKPQMSKKFYVAGVTKLMERECLISCWQISFFAVPNWNFVRVMGFDDVAQWQLETLEHNQQEDSNNCGVLLLKVHI